MTEVQSDVDGRVIYQYRSHIEGRAYWPYEVSLNGEFVLTLDAADYVSAVVEGRTLLGLEEQFVVQEGFNFEAYDNGDIVSVSQMSLEDYEEFYLNTL